MATPDVIVLTKISADGTLFQASDVDFTNANANVFENTAQFPLSRQDRPRMGEVWSKAAFSVQLAGSGIDPSVTATPPVFDALLTACSLKKTVNVGTSVVYESEGTTVTLGAANAGVTINQVIGDQYKNIIGVAVGKLVLEFTNGEPGKAIFDFDGKYIAPTDASSSDTLGTTARPPVCKAMTVTLGGINLIPKKVTIDLGNVILSPRGDLTGTNSIINALVVDQQPVITVEAEKIAVATFNSVTRAIAETKTTLAIVLGATVGNILTIGCDMYPMDVPQFSDVGGILGQTLVYKQSWASGDTQFTMTYT